MGDTEIGWCHRPGTRARTWNPFRGCEACSPGCAHCYAARQGARYCGPGGVFEGFITRAKNGLPIWTGEADLIEHKLIEPLSWRERSTVFVNSMSDLFYQGFSFEEIAAAYVVMALTPEHTYQVLTKRPERALEFYNWLYANGPSETWVTRLNAAFVKYVKPLRSDAYWIRRLSFEASDGGLERPINSTHWAGGDGPLENLWLGVSAEDQAHYDERLPYLLEIRAAVKFLSLEPLLGPIDLDIPMCPDCGGTDAHFEPGSNAVCKDGCSMSGEWGTEMGYGNWNNLDGGVSWVIIGCESGPDARPCEVAWIDAIIKRCEDDGVSVFLKQAYARDAAGESEIMTHGIGFGEGSEKKVGIGAAHGKRPTITAPYLHGKQYLQFPELDDSIDAAAHYGG